MATPRRSPRIAAQAIVPGTPTIKMTIPDNTSDAEIEKIKQENRDLRAAQRKERREALTAKTAQLVKMINERIPSEQDDKINPNIDELVAANHAAHNELAQNLANIRINVDKLVAMTDDQHKVILKIVEEVGQLKVQPKVQKPKDKTRNPFKRFYQFITTPFCT
jgi:hypothetical protein